MKAMRPIPGIDAAATTDLPVLKPLPPGGYGGAADDLKFSRFLANMPWWVPAGFAFVIVLHPLTAYAQSGLGLGRSVDALWRWIPYLLLSGFFMNVVISVLTMAIGTAAGLVLGLMQISPVAAIRKSAWVVTQVFRNSPWLVLLFIVMLAFPFEVTIAGVTISIPDWVKAVFGLSLPIMANIAEVVRGAIQSVPWGQWEAADSLAFSRQQILWRIILPQCFKRMIPPWMNWYAILTMATPLVSLLGVEEIVTLSRQAMVAENSRPELLVPFYGFCLVVFFIYCYPIARFTMALERRFNVKL